MSLTIIDRPTTPPLQSEDEIVHVFCERCTADTAYWPTPRSAVAGSVEAHVILFHAPNGVGPTRPSGAPVWVEGEDWWVVEDDC